MTAPRWISEAIEASATLVTPELISATTKELLERLPIEAITVVLRGIVGPAGLTALEQPGSLASIVSALTDGDPEVVELTELYQGACRALDAAGVPYDRALTDDGDLQVVRLNLAGRIQWLAQHAAGEAAHNDRELVDLRRRFDDLQRDRDRLARDLNLLQGDLATAERRLRDAERELQRYVR